MALFWFLLALVLLVAALVILRLDARQRRDDARAQSSASGDGPEGYVAGDDDAPRVDDDDEDPHSAVPADEVVTSAGSAESASESEPAAESAESADEPSGEPGGPKLAPFQRAGTVGAVGAAGLATTAGAPAADASDADVAEKVPAQADTQADPTSAVDADGKEPATDTNTDATDAADSATDVADDAATSSDEADASGTGSKKPGLGAGVGLGAGAAAIAGAGAAADLGGRTSAKRGPGSDAPAGTRANVDADATADDEALAAASSSGAYAVSSEQADKANQQEQSAQAERSESSPRLLDRVRALLPARRTNGRAIEKVAPEPMDPLAGSPIVRWLEDREFAPTQTPAPEFRHGDFASGLSALGTVSHGVFRGRRAIMGVTGGRTVLALRRDTASDMILDLSRPDVEAEPGFHDAGEVGVLEARTSDYGRLDLIDRDRFIEAVGDVPAGVRRIWAEGEWVAATIDGVNDPSAWDDVVMALHAAADVLAPFPPIGGRARALPAEIDPGAPAAAAGPEADPTMGMDGEVGTGTHGVAPMPEAGDDVVVDTPAVPSSPAAPGAAAASGTPAVPAAAAADAGSTASATPAAPADAAPQPRRSGHLRLVADRTARDLTDAPVVADRGDAEEDDATPPTTTASAAAKADAAATGMAAKDSAAAEDAAAPGPATPEPVAPEPEPEPEPEPDPFAEIMEPSAPVEARGDVAADHLEPRPPLSRPTRGVGQSYPEDTTVPPLAAGAATGGAGIKPLGSEDDEDEIRDEVERFDAARIDGRSDLDESSAGRHGTPDEGSAGRHGVEDLDPSEVTQRLSVADLAARMGISPEEMRTEGRRRRRRAEPEDEADGEAVGDTGTSPGTGTGTGTDTAPGRERPGVEPDVEQTARIVLPPDIKD